MTDADGIDWPPLPDLKPPARGFLSPTGRIHFEQPKAQSPSPPKPLSDMLVSIIYALSPGGRTHTHIPRQGGKMNRKQVILQQLKMLQAEYAKLSRYPEDNFEDGTVIRFDRVFGVSWHDYANMSDLARRDLSVYSYAAIKVKGRWYTTGPKSPKAYTWDELTEWLGDAVGPLTVMEPGRKIDLDITNQDPALIYLPPTGDVRYDITVSEPGSVDSKQSDSD